MLFQPAIIALLLAAGLGVLMLALATPFALQVIRHWDIHSGSEYQLLLERRTFAELEEACPQPGASL